MSTPTVTALIPARGGSKTVKRKNLVEVAGKPLILHILDTLRHVEQVGRIVVTTDDDEIRNVVEAHGYETVGRPDGLADDDATVDDVVAWYVTSVAGVPYGPLLVVQPTVPLIRASTFNQFIEYADKHPSDVLTMATAIRHMVWSAPSVNDALIPPKHRVNRQQTPYRLNYREVGIRFYPPGVYDPPNRTFQLGTESAVDIDTLADLAAVRQALTRRSVVFEFIAGGQVGYGHLHRTLTLAEHLQHHDVQLVYRGSDRGVQRLLDRRGWDWHESDLELYDVDPGVWILDVLDTKTRHVADLAADGWKVVTLEDHGYGARFADLTVNALYLPSDPFFDRHTDRILSGSRYAVLRPEFLSLPDRQIREQPRRVLVTFGGTDPAGLTERVERLLVGRAYPNVQIKVIEPPGRGSHQKVSMAAEMLMADLVVTSAGRTVYEAAATGTPAVVIAHNPREVTHAHVKPGYGNVFLGMAGIVDDSEIVRTVDYLLGSVETRRALSTEGRASVDGKGARRIVRRIEDLLEGL